MIEVVKDLINTKITGMNIIKKAQTMEHLSKETTEVNSGRDHRIRETNIIKKMILITTRVDIKMRGFKIKGNLGFDKDLTSTNNKETEALRICLILIIIISVLHQV